MMHVVVFWAAVSALVFFVRARASVQLRKIHQRFIKDFAEKFQNDMLWNTRTEARISEERSCFKADIRQ